MTGKVWLALHKERTESTVIGVSATAQGAMALADKHHALYWENERTQAARHHGYSSAPGVQATAEETWKQWEAEVYAREIDPRRADAGLVVFPVQLDTVVNIHGWPAFEPIEGP